MERIILTSGGTGGHVFPALALAEELRRRNPGAMIVFMGGRHGQEADMAAKAGLDFVGLPVRGILGRGGRGLLAAFAMLGALAKACGIIRRIRPELVVGFGGYACFAGVLAARIAGKRTAIHEQNAYPGMANRLLGKVVDRVFLSMPDAAAVFDPKKTVLVGNPVRAAIAGLYEKRLAQTAAPGVKAPADSPAPRRFRLLVMGGSQGARVINQTMTRVIELLLEAGIDIWHQTGQADYESVRAAYRESGAEHVRVESFITDMRRAYSWADLVLCRAGGSSMAEITVAGLPAILVPLPQAAQDHQRHNARFLEKEGGAVLLEQREFYSDSNSWNAPGAGNAAGPGKAVVLARTILDLIRNQEALDSMARNSLAAARPHAARDLADELEALRTSSGGNV